MTLFSIRDLSFISLIYPSIHLSFTLTQSCPPTSTLPCYRFLSLSEMVDAARKALICRVEELTNERSTLNLEVRSSQETIARLEGKMREMEEETKR